MLKVYQVFKQNITSARSIADAPGIGRTKVNDILNRLQILGFIERNIDWAVTGYLLIAFLQELCYY